MQMFGNVWEKKQLYGNIRESKGIQCTSRNISLILQTPYNAELLQNGQTHIKNLAVFAAKL